MMTEDENITLIKKHLLLFVVYNKVIVNKRNLDPRLLTTATFDKYDLKSS